MAVLVGQKAPHFSAAAVLDGNKIVGDFSLDQYIDNKYVVLFFYPKDFTFVCPTELGDLADNYEHFQDLGVDISTRLEQLKVEEPPKRKAGIKVSSVAELVSKLKNEAKVI